MSRAACLSFGFWCRAFDGGSCASMLAASQEYNVSGIVEAGIPPPPPHSPSAAPVYFSQCFFEELRLSAHVINIGRYGPTGNQRPATLAGNFSGYELSTTWGLWELPKAVLRRLARNAAFTMHEQCQIDTEGPSNDHAKCCRYNQGVPIQPSSSRTGGLQIITHGDYMVIAAVIHAPSIHALPGELKHRIHQVRSDSGKRGQETCDSMRLATLRVETCAQTSKPFAPPPHPPIPRPPVNVPKKSGGAKVTEYLETTCWRCR